MHPDTLFYIDSHSIDSARERLIGYFQTRDHIVFGDAGLQEYRRDHPGKLDPLDGAFLALLDRGEYLEASTDATGQELLYLYRAAGSWAVSNSLYHLAKKVRLKGYELTPRPPSLLSFTIKDGNHWAAQPFSMRTVFNEVVLLPPGSSVRIERRTGALSVLHRSIYDGLESFRGMSYEDIVAQFLESAVAEIRGLGEVDGLDLRCQLSGGYDSRVTYGLFLSSGLPTDRYVVESAKGKAADFGVAQELASKHGHRLNTRGVGTAATIDSDEAYQLWKLGNMGSYLPIYSVKHRSTRFALKARGDLWTSTKFYQKSPERITKTIVKSVPDNRGRCVGQDWWDGLADIGVDYRSAEALMLHYSAFRSRFHCGRRWYKNLGHHVLYSPLVSRSLGAAAIESSRKGWGDKRLSMDLLLALGNGLASVRFDARSKAFRNSELRESPFRGGIAISDSRKAVYWGRERAVPQEKMGCGLSDTGLRERLLEEYHLVEREVKRAGILPTRVFKKAVAEQKEGGSLSHGLRMTTLVLFAAFTLGVERY